MITVRVSTPCCSSCRVMGTAPYNYWVLISRLDWSYADSDVWYCPKCSKDCSLELSKRLPAPPGPLGVGFWAWLRWKVGGRG